MENWALVTLDARTLRTPAYFARVPRRSLHLTVKYGAAPHLLCRRAKYCLSAGVSRDFSPAVLAGREERGVDNRRRVFTRVRDSYDLHSSGDCRKYGHGQDSQAWAKTFPPIRLSAQNSCQHTDPLPAAPSRPGWKDVKRRGRGGSRPGGGREAQTLETPRLVEWRSRRELLRSFTVIIVPIDTQTYIIRK